MVCEQCYRRRWQQVDRGNQLMIKCGDILRRREFVGAAPRILLPDAACFYRDQLLTEWISSVRELDNRI